MEKNLKDSLEKLDRGISDVVESTGIRDLIRKPDSYIRDLFFSDKYNKKETVGEMVKLESKVMEMERIPVYVRDMLSSDEQVIFSTKDEFSFFPKSIYVTDKKIIVIYPGLISSTFDSYSYQNILRVRVINGLFMSRLEISMIVNTKIQNIEIITIDHIPYKDAISISKLVEEHINR